MRSRQRLKIFHDNQLRWALWVSTVNQAKKKDKRANAQWGGRIPILVWWFSHHDFGRREFP
jgi:hypothetical protein